MPRFTGLVVALRNLFLDTRRTSAAINCHIAFFRRAAHLERLDQSPHGDSSFLVPLFDRDLVIYGAD